jgi:protein TonB
MESPPGWGVPWMIAHAAPGGGWGDWFQPLRPRAKAGRVRPILFDARNAALAACALLAGAAAAQAPASPPAAPARPPPGNFADYISSEDYPGGALADEHEGTVGFVVTVGTNGRVTDCTITLSSGYGELDAGTCRLARRRLRFNPGHEAGRTAAMRSREFRIRWVMPGAQPRGPRRPPAN